MADIALTQAQRGSIATLRDIQSLSDRTQERLSTGREVNNVIDDAVAYFTSQSLQNRSTDFLDRKDYIDQGISTLQASLNATESIDELLQQMKGVAEAAKSQTQAERISATTQFETIGTQISQLIEDASYNGYNLLSDVNNRLEVRFSERTASRITIGGFDLNATDTTEALSTRLFSSVAFDGNSANNAFLGISTVMSAIETDAEAGFTSMGANNSNLILAETVINNLDGAITRLRAVASELGSNVSLLQTRADFAQAYTDTLSTGADKLTLADMNEEGANLTALQTRQQLGIQALAISGDQAGSVITLVQ
ncbi:MAG: flagellin [Alphaproteobacteria bacterium]